MRRSHEGVKFWWLLALLCLSLSFPGLARAAAGDLQVFPNDVEIGSFFKGEAISVRVEIPAGTDAILEVLGPSHDEKLVLKGRRGGLWMNVGDVQVQGVPSLYLAAATRPRLLTNPEGDQPWGYQALKRRASFSGTPAAPGTELFDQFVKFKESEEVYALLPEALKTRPAGAGGAQVRADFWLPGKITPDTYRVRLSVLQGGQVVAQKETEVRVEMVGFPAFLKVLAYQQGALYGILAVLIAILTGFAMGYLFKGKGGGH